MNLIGGRWVPARSGRTMEDRNPADGDDKLGDVARSDSEDVAAAVDKTGRIAASGFSNGGLHAFLLTPG